MTPDPLEEHRDEILDQARASAREAMRPRPRPGPGGSAMSWSRSTRGRTVIGAALLVLIVALASLLGWIALDARSQAQDAAASAAANANGLDEANSRIVDLGGTPVPTPSSGAQGDRGATGRTGPAPRSEQIQAAVALYCAQRSDCAGTPSRVQVTAAVRAYCATGVCRGARGRTGPSGSSGSPGASGSPGQSGAPGPVGATGVPGASPSDGDIAAAIAAYCQAHGDCTGPAGPRGEQGAQGDRGATGRGIASIDCTGLGVDRLRITYDDGTAQDVPCDLDQPTDTNTPTPTPSETPS